MTRALDEFGINPGHNAADSRSAERGLVSASAAGSCFDPFVSTVSKALMKSQYASLPPSQPMAAVCVYVCRGRAGEGMLFCYVIIFGLSGDQELLQRVYRNVSFS